MLVHADLGDRAFFEREAAEANAARGAKAIDVATREFEVAAAWAARDKAAATTKAEAEAKESKDRAEHAAHLKEWAELGVGTPEFRKQLELEMNSLDGGFHGLDAKTGERLKLDESVRRLRSMRAELATNARKNKERASQVPLNDPVYREGTNIFLGRAAQAKTTTLPSAPLAGAVECAHALVKLKKMQHMSDDGSASWIEANGARKRLRDWTESRGRQRVFQTDLVLLGERARSQLVSESTEQEDTSAKRALQRRQTELQLAREARKARNLLHANSWMGLTSDGKQTKYFKMLAWFKEQDELAQQRRANKGHNFFMRTQDKRANNAARPNPNYNSLGGAGHAPMAEAAKLGQPAPDFGSLDWLMPSEPPPSERPKRARPHSPTTFAPKRIAKPSDINFIFALGPPSQLTSSSTSACAMRQKRATTTQQMYLSTC